MSKTLVVDFLQDQAKTYRQYPVNAMPKSWAKYNFSTQVIDKSLNVASLANAYATGSISAGITNPFSDVNYIHVGQAAQVSGNPLYLSGCFDSSLANTTSWYRTVAVQGSTRLNPGNACFSLYGDLAA